MKREVRRTVILAPLATWAALMVLLTITAIYAYLPGVPIKPVISLVIGIIKALLIALFFMQLRKSAGLVRIAAMLGLVWGSFMFMLTFSDILTR